MTHCTVLDLITSNFKTSLFCRILDKFTRRTKLIWIIGDLAIQHLDKWSSTALISSLRDHRPCSFFFWFLWQCCLGFRSALMWCCVIGWMFLYILRIIMPPAHQEPLALVTQHHIPGDPSVSLVCIFDITLWFWCIITAVCYLPDIWCTAAGLRHKPSASERVSQCVQHQENQRSAPIIQTVLHEHT